MTLPIDASQRQAARAVGVAYLLAVVTGWFGEFYVRGKLIDFEDAAETARNIMANETLFRLGIASEIITFALSVLLLASLYVILEPVNPYLAVLAASFRLVEVSLCAVMTLTGLDVLRLLSSVPYLRVFEVDRLHALARLHIGAHGATFNVAFVFFGVGSALFSYLWLKSKYIPRALAALGVFGSSLIAVSALTFVVFPGLQTIASPFYFLPIFLFELAMGFWLVFKDLRPSPVVREGAAA